MVFVKRSAVAAGLAAVDTQCRDLDDRRTLHGELDDALSLREARALYSEMNSFDEKAYADRSITNQSLV
jgi:hypothetical protein